MLVGNAIGPSLVLPARRHHGEAEFFGDRPADEAPYGMRLPAGGFHDGGERGAFRLPEHGHGLGLFAAIAPLLGDWRGFRGSRLLCCACGPLLRDSGDQALDCLPDAGDRGFAVSELFNIPEVIEAGRTGESVPGIDQAGSGPVRRECTELLFSGKGLQVCASRKIGVQGDVVVGIDGVCCHCDTIHHSVRLENQLKSAASEQKV